MRLLLIEDNERLAELLGKGLKANGFAVDSFSTLGEAEAALAGVPYQAMILDLGLPDGDGLTLLSNLRKKSNGIPVLILTARDDLQDRVRGLNVGADDYVVKPVAIDELVARLRALLRRPGLPLSVQLSCADLSFDSATREVRVRDELLVLSRRETELLEHLIRRAGHVVPKQLLEENLYNFDADLSSNSVEALVSRLRKRLSQAAARATIHTLRGVGYMLAEDRPQ